MQEAAKIASMFRAKSPINYDDSMGSMQDIDKLSNTDNRGDYSNRSERNAVLDDFDYDSYHDILHDIEVFFTQIPEKIKQAQMFKSRRASLVGSLKKEVDAQFEGLVSELSTQYYSMCETLFPESKNVSEATVRR